MSDWSVATANPAAAALADARADRGQWLTADERAALNHKSRWGSDGYPLHKLHHGKWILNHAIAKGTPVYKTKREAVAAWETLIDILIVLSGIEARNRAIAERDGNADTKTT